MKVNEYMEAEGLENVYVVGDLSYYELEEAYRFRKLLKRQNLLPELRQTISSLRSAAANRKSFLQNIMAPCCPSVQDMVLPI